MIVIKLCNKLLVCRLIILYNNYVVYVYIHKLSQFTNNACLFLSKLLISLLVFAIEEKKKVFENLLKNETFEKISCLYHYY